ncbi:MAG: CopL family metal-binding regulatory protein [Bacteroidetes bacterium]|nr:CopL family metal-binding regulatory protein [Bacteroidota bacterium]
MRPWSILLRVLLSLTLVLNGAMSAMAATSMQMNHATTHVPIKAVAQQDTSCHQHHQARVAASDSASSGKSLPAPEKSKHPAPDCCKFGTCACACTHLAQATFPTFDIGASAFDGHSSSGRWLTSAHTAPALPHLIRPPIG